MRIVATALHYTRNAPESIGYVPIRAIGLTLAAVLLVLTLAAAAPATSLEQWRAAADADRALAENDVPRAHAEALRLLAALPPDASAADRSQALNLLARTEIYLGSSAHADAHARQALALARQSGNRIDRAQADLNLALTSVNLGRIGELRAVATDAVAVLGGLKDPGLMGEALLRAAMMYMRLGRINHAVTIGMRAWDIARRNRNPLALTYAAEGLGMAFGQSGHAAQSRRYFTRMLMEARAAHSRLLEADALRSLADAYDRVGQTARAQSLDRQAIALYRLAGSPLNVDFGLMGLASHLHEHGHYHQAQSLLSEAIAGLRRHPTPIALWYALNARSENEQSLGELPSARADAEQAYAIAKQIGFPRYMSRSAWRLAALAASAGDFRRAYRRALAADAINSSAVATRRSGRVLALASQYERESRQREIAALRERDLRQRTALRQHALKERLLLTMLCGALGIAAVTGFFMLRLRRLNAGLERRVQERTAELRQQASYLRTLIDTLPLRIWLKDTQSRYLAANRAEAQAGGRALDEIVGRSDIDLWPAEVAEAHRAGDRDVMARRQRAKVEEALPLADGAAQWVETYRAPVLDDDGTLLGTVGASYDISERKAAEAAREAALAEARRLVRLRSDFMAQMSHELRTPLNGILGYAALLERDPDLRDDQRGALEVIRHSGEHLLGLINEVLDFARIEAGKLELDRAVLALGPFLRSIAGLIVIRAQIKGLAFATEISPEAPEAIVADERRLRQVLINLLANAVAFTDRGSIRLRVWCPVPQRLRFEIEDTGIGIPAGQLEAIFQPFEQMAEGQRRGGTGLGLPISRRYVRLMGSDIEVESRVGVGSTFRFDLAVEEAAAPAQIARAVADAPTAEAGAFASSAGENVITPPPPAQIEHLHALALEGNMRDIVRWAADINELEGQRYRHFALRVRFLAERYQSQAILSLAKRCLGAGGD
jgi:PAS domain S-box-containing protein